MHSVQNSIISVSALGYFYTYPSNMCDDVLRDLLPPLGGIVIRRVCWLVDSFVSSLVKLVVISEKVKFPFS